MVRSRTIISCRSSVLHSFRWLLNALLVLTAWAAASGQSRVATTTTIALTASGGSVTSVTSGTVVSLKATVQEGGTPVTVGQVNFCEAAATLCTDIHLLGTAQLTAAGTATLKFRPGIGAHTYQAVFAGTTTNAASSSSAAALTVTGLYPSFTTIQQSGSPGYYALTANVMGMAHRASPPAPTGTVSFIDTTSANAVLATASVGSANPGLQFLNSSSPATVTEPNFVAAADFNGDGIEDLAVSNSNTGATSLTILLGKGDGTFTATATSPTVGLYPDCIAVGDFNGDGIPDLAVSSVDDYKVTILLGNGDGTFASAPTLNTVSSPQSVAAGDFNGDGIADLAVVNGGSVLIFLGKGDGTFTQTTSSPSVSPSPITVVAGDFNRDGIADLAVSYGGNTGQIAILLGNGDGTFRAGPGPLTAGSSAVGLAVADLNGDGFVDLVATDYFDSGVNVLLGKGDGSFQPAAFYSALGLNARSVTVADFDGDGIPDLAVGKFWQSGPAILVGKGDGTFGAPVNSTISISLASGYVAVADFNGDGIPDLAEPNSDLNGTVVVELVQPGELVSATVQNINPVGPGPHQVEASYSGDSNYLSSISGLTSLTSVVATPTISLASGTYTSVQSITLADSTPGATIYYQASGSVNTTGFVPYSGAIALNTGGAEYLTVYATATGSNNSNYVSANYYLNLPVAPAPTFSPVPGVYASAQQVTISDAVQGATIFYTTDGSWPTVYSKPYTGPLTLSSSDTLAAVAVAPGYSLSGPSTAQYTISSSATSFIYTVAGTAGFGFSGDGGPATEAEFSYLTDALLDSAGNLYISDTNNNVIRKVAAGTGIITTIAGTGIGGYSGDGGAATSAQLLWPSSLALDASGNLYIGDAGNYVVRKIQASTGIISTVAGNGNGAFSGDGGPATNAGLSGIGGIAVDASGNLYVSDEYAGRVRKVDAGTGTITTVAGGVVNMTTSGYTGDGGPATSASLDEPEGLAFDVQGNLYIADTYDNVIRRVTASTQVITTFAGNGYAAGGGSGGHTGDGGPATSAELGQPEAIAFDASGNLYISEHSNRDIRRVDAATNLITTIAGTSGYCNYISGDAAPAAEVSLCWPQGLSLDRGGNLYLAETQGRVRMITAPAAPPSTAAAPPTFNIAGGTFAGPQTISVADTTPGAAIYVTYDGTTPTTLSPAYRGPINVNGSITLKAIAAAPGYLASQPVTAAFTITAPPSVVVSTVAGSGPSSVPSQAGLAATSTIFRENTDVVLDSAGNLYIADSGNDVVWKISASTGTASIIAGTLGVAGGTTGNGGLATSAKLDAPMAVAIDGAGNVYIADTRNNEIRKVDVSTGIISDFAGGGNRYALNLGDGGPAASAALSWPQSIRFDASGNLYIADTQDQRVRMVSAGTGIMTTVAGTGSFSGSLGDGGPATSARLLSPTAIALDAHGNLYIADTGNYRVREVAAGTGIISTIAGNGNNGTSGDGLLATEAEVDPFGLIVDQAGDIYISDGLVVRELAAGSNVLTTIAGNGYAGYTGDGVSATLTSLCGPQGLAFDSAGSLYVADSCGDRVRKLSFSNNVATPQFSLAAGTYTAVQTVSINDATPGATVYYTTDGTVPTTNSLVYSGAVPVTHSMTLQAIAFVSGNGASPVAAAAYVISLPKPVVTVTPSSSSILSTDPLSVTIAVAGANGSPTPTGSVTVSSRSYTSAAANLSNGTTTISIAAGSLPAGTDTLTATYTPDAGSLNEFASSSGTAVVIVTSPRITPVVTVSPDTQSVSTVQTLGVVVAVTGTNGSASPTGSVILSSGSYQSAATSLNAGAAAISIPAGSLTAGTNTLTATYTPDASGSATFNSATGSAAVTVTKASPAIAISLSPTAITTAQSLTVTIAVSGGTSLVPAGTVALTSGSYSVQQALASGSTAMTIPAGTLPAGTDTLTVTYSPDAGSTAIYTSGSQTATVIVTLPIDTTIPAITLTPSAGNVTDQQAVTMAVSVAGSSGQPTPTGSITLTAGPFSAQQTLSAGAASVQIPAGTLSVGTDTITVVYSGDPTYAAGSASTTITVSSLLMTASSPASVAPGSAATSTLKLTAGSGYSGTLSLTCALTSSPSGARSLPTCNLSPNSVTITTGGSVTSTLTIQTTASSGTALLHPAADFLRWFGTGGATLAAFFFFGIPARRRRWLAGIALVIFIAGLGAIGCGGGGGGGNPGSGGSPSTPATTAGTYVIAVNAIDSSNSKTIATATVSITVQ